MAAVVLVLIFFYADRLEQAKVTRFPSSQGEAEKAVISLYPRVPQKFPLALWSNTFGARRGTRRLGREIASATFLTIKLSSRAVKGKLVPAQYRLTVRVEIPLRRLSPANRKRVSRSLRVSIRLGGKSKFLRKSCHKRKCIFEGALPAKRWVNGRSTPLTVLFRKKRGGALIVRGGAMLNLRDYTWGKTNAPPAPFLVMGVVSGVTRARRAGEDLTVLRLAPGALRLRYAPRLHTYVPLVLPAIASKEVTLLVDTESAASGAAENLERGVHVRAAAMNYFRSGRILTGVRQLAQVDEGAVAFPR
jgi:hypothetical protein